MLRIARRGLQNLRCERVSMAGKKATERVAIVHGSEKRIAGNPGSRPRKLNQLAGIGQIPGEEAAQTDNAFIAYRRRLDDDTIAAEDLQGNDTLVGEVDMRNRRISLKQDLVLLKRNVFNIGLQTRKVRNRHHGQQLISGHRIAPQKPLRGNQLIHQNAMCRFALEPINSTPGSIQHVNCETRSPLLQQDASASLDGALQGLGKLVQQPRQGYFEAHIVVGDLDVAGSGLAERPHPEIESIARPSLFLHLQHRESLRRLIQRRPYAAQGFILAEPVWNGDDEGFGHGPE